MATVYKVKDGPQEDGTDQGTEMPIQELSAKLANYRCRYLSDLSETPPPFDADNPSDYYRHVVIEVSEAEVNDRFPKKGFYLVDNLDVSRAGFLYQ